MRKPPAVYCRREGCGYEWERDPVLSVACPVCNARIGTECSTVAPSGHRKSNKFTGALPAWGHDERDIAASEAGAYCHPCAGAHGRCNCELATAGPGLELRKRRKAKAVKVPHRTWIGNDLIGSIVRPMQWRRWGFNRDENGDSHDYEPEHKTGNPDVDKWMRYRCVCDCCMSDRYSDHRFRKACSCKAVEAVAA